MKLEEMREKTVDELKAAVVDFKKQLFDLRVKASLHKLEKTSEISSIKNMIAQIKTVIREKI